MSLHLGSPIVEDDSAISGLEPDDAAQGSGQDELQWVPADSEEAADFATPEQRKNVAAWKVYKRVPPKEQFEVEMNNEELRKSPRWHRFATAGCPTGS